MKRAHLSIGLSCMYFIGSISLVEGFTLSRNESADISGGYFPDAHLYDTSSLFFHNGWIDDIYLHNNSKLSFFDGYNYFITAYDNSSIELMGGHVINGVSLYGASSATIYNSDCSLLAYKQSTIDIRGGTFRSLGAADNSSLSISGGEIKQASIRGNSSLRISGGSISTGIHVRDNSRLDITDGIVNWADTNADGSIYITGGVINGLSAIDNSTIDIFGGVVGGLTARHNSTVSIYGYDVYGTSGLDLVDGKVVGTGLLSGKWNDGSVFAIHILENAQTAIIHIIPEPTSILLLGLGGFLVRLRRK